MANGLTAKCLLIVFMACSAFGSVENKDRLKNLKEGFYSKSASHEISRRTGKSAIVKSSLFNNLPGDLFSN